LDDQISKGDLQGREQGEASEISKCLFFVCLNTLLPNHEQKCWDCVGTWARKLPVMGTSIGPTGVPLGYLLGMLQIPVTSLMLNDTESIYAYNKVFCGSIDTKGCNKKVAFPGPNTTSYMSHAEVVKLGKQYPAKLWSGEWFRGFELGLLILDPYLWSGFKEKTHPFGLQLGITPSQHVAIFDVLKEAFTLGGSHTPKYKKAQGIIDTMLNDFFQKRKEAGSLNVKGDLFKIIFQIINKVSFDEDISWEDAGEFTDFQTSALGISVLGVLIPDFLAPLLSGYRRTMTKYTSMYIQITERLYGKKLDQNACKPTVNCTLQAAASLNEALLFAGGVSVPTNLATGLGLLYSTNPGNPFPEKKIPNGKELNFWWENIRLFAPVLGFPSWSVRPTCPGLNASETAALNLPNGKQKPCPPYNVDIWTQYSQINQYQGGTRQAPLLAMAQRDPKVWGDNANDFVLRPLGTYMKNSVGFAEMAENIFVQWGKNDRKCPGKSMALMIGESFFKLFKKEEWVVDNPEDIAFTSGPSWVSDFILKPKVAR